MTEPQWSENEKSRFYWFFYNVRTRVRASVKAWIKRHPIWTTIIVLLIINALVTARGSYQPVFLEIRKHLALAFLVLIVLGLFYLYVRKRTWKKNIIPTVLLLVFLAASILAGPGVHEYFSLYFRYATLNKTELRQMPVSDHERIQPINSIKTLIDQDALSETEDATMPVFTRGHDGQYYFTSAIGPSRSYLIQRFSKDMYEILHVPAHLSSPVFSKNQRDKVEFEIGEQLLFSRKTENAVIKRFGFGEFFSCEPSEPVFLQDDEGAWVQVVPIVRWEGFIFPRPVFGGVYVIAQHGKGDNYFKRVYLGKGEHIDADVVTQKEYLKGQNLQPKKVMDFVANSFKFANGFLAPMPGYHEGDIRIPHVANEQKPMPYVTFFELNGEGKLYNYYGLEPFEEDKKGLSLSLFIAGDNDEEIFFINHRREKYIGSGAISAKIIESKKNYDWTMNYPAESRPFVRNIDGKNRFFWLTTVVSRAGDEGQFIGGSVPEICLTDAVHGKVVWIDPESQMEPDLWAEQAKEQLKHHWEAE